MRYLILILSILSIVSCAKNETISFNYQKLKSKTIFDNNIFGGAELIYIDTAIKNFSRDLILKKSLNNYYLFDYKNQQIIVTNKELKHKKTLSNFTFAKDITTDSLGNLVILCNANDSIMVYDANLNQIYGKSLNINALSVEQLNNNYVFFKDRINDSIFGNNTIIITDNHFNPIFATLPLPENSNTIAFQDNLNSAENKFIVFTHSLDNNIYHINRDTVTIPYTLNFGNNYNAQITRAYENTKYLVVLLTEDTQENDVAFLIYNKENKQTKFQKFILEDIEIKCLGAPLALTEDNQLIFAPDTFIIYDLMRKYPLFANMQINGDGAYSLIKLKLL